MIHDRIRQKVELAQTYALDGAFRTAARILRETADLIDRHIARCDAAMADLRSDPVNLQGSGPAAIEPREG